MVSESSYILTPRIKNFRILPCYSDISERSLLRTFLVKMPQKRHVSDHPEKNTLDSNPEQLEGSFTYDYLMLIGNPCCQFNKKRRSGVSWQKRDPERALEESELP